uniref:Uncharacterized protein n=2 Tax=Anguilla anguilla TaxID=7936 RepID=A0A0E9RHK5_ANGAN
MYCSQTTSAVQVDNQHPLVPIQKLKGLILKSFLKLNNLSTVIYKHFFYTCI